MLLRNPDDQKLRGEVLDLYEVRESHGVVEWRSEGEGAVTVEAQKGNKEGWMARRCGLVGVGR